ncbi:MAG: DNA repair protein RecO [Planctomyces sp.]|nr:DNA repair protein RecO [Planctomyces sp.]MBA4039070.1 DNA repair protein RecO [Planctomyces sp.]MBA4119503.1 DNA repair protein RecO [Isosphaera sp.]
MSKVFDQAVCVQQWDYSETSQTCLLFTLEHGLVRALAKGSRRAGAPYSGGLEGLTAGVAGLILKPTTELALLTEWDLREPMGHLRRDLSAHRAGVYVADVARGMTLDHDPHAGMFAAVLRALRDLASPGAAESALGIFQARALWSAGLAPDLERTAGSGAQLPSRGVLLYHPDLGGVIGGERPEAHRGQGWPVRAQTVALAAGLLRRAAQEARAGPPGASAAPIAQVRSALGDRHDQRTWARAARLLAAVIRHVIGRELVTLGLVFPDLVAAGGTRTAPPTGPGRQGPGTGQRRR